MRANLRDRRASSNLLGRVIVAGLVLGGVASVTLNGAGGRVAPAFAEGDAQAPAAKPARAVPTAPAKKPNATANAARTATKSVTPAPKSAPSVTVVRPVATPNSAPVVKRANVSQGPAPVVQTPARLDEPLTYQYNALGRRDPFQSLLSGEYVGAEMGGDAPPDVGALKVVGIVWGDADQFALVEDARGDSHILRRGDKVQNGYVEALKRNGMVVNLTVDGQSQSVTVPLTRKGENSNANR